MRGRGLLPRVPRHDQAAEVGDVLAQRQLAVDVNGVDGDELVELIHHPLRLRGVVLGIRRGPPVVQVALAVELPALVVESVRHLVPDHGAHRAVVERVVGSRIVIGRLQDAGREHDLVHRGIVVGVDGGRCHPPLGAVDRAPDLVQIAPPFELRGVLEVGHVRAARQHQRRVIAPAIGIADLVVERGQLDDGGAARRIAHPAERAEARAQRSLEILHHLARLLLGLGRKVELHVLLPQHLAERVVRRIQTALPARQERLRAGQHLRETEVLVDERRAEHG